jgi:Transposase DDE domain group 1
LIGQLAFNLVAWFKRLCLPKSEHTARIKTLRHRLFNLAAKVVSSGRQLFLVISDDYRYQHLWSFALNKLATLATRALIGGFGLKFVGHFRRMRQ